MEVKTVFGILKLKRGMNPLSNATIFTTENYTSPHQSLKNEK